MTNKQSSEGIEDKTKSADLARRRFTKSGLASIRGYSYPCKPAGIGK